MDDRQTWYLLCGDSGSVIDKCTTASKPRSHATNVVTVSYDCCTGTRNCTVVARSGTINIVVEYNNTVILLASSSLGTQPRRTIILPY